MKNNLLIGKAVLTALMLFVLGFASINTFAQVQVATLQHGEDFNAFYGINAFIEAHEAAVDGDIITLSSGNFNAANITKAITLHGAGVEAEAQTQTNLTPTYISGDFMLNILNENMSLNIEGIVFQSTASTNGTLHHANIYRCNFYNLSTSQDSAMDDVQFVNCKFDMINYFKSSIFSHCLYFRY